MKLDSLKRRIIKERNKAERYKEVKNFIKNPYRLSSPEKAETIVSLTSYGDRLASVHLAIASIMDQTMRPDSVVLYLDVGSNNRPLPLPLARLEQESGLIIKRGYPNLRAHLKYFYSIQEFPDSNIVTIDDDIIYQRDTLEQLNKLKEAHPGCVVARRGHKIKTDGDLLLPYASWYWEWNKSEPSTVVVATGVGGVLYPKRLLPSSAFNVNRLKKYSLENDDLWLWANEHAANISTVVSTKVPELFEIKGSQRTALNKTNVRQSKNDEIMLRLMNEYDISVQSLG